MTPDPLHRGRRLGALGRRLLASFGAVAIVGVVVVGAAGLIGSDRGLSADQAQARRSAAEQVAAAVASAYLRSGSWAGADLTYAGTLAAGASAGLIVRDATGTVTSTTINGHQGTGAGPAGAGAARSGRITLPVTAGGDVVGSVTLGFGSPVSDGRQVAWTWILAGALAAVAAALGAAWLTIRSLTAPLIALTDATRAFAAGDRGARPAVRGIGELGELADAFDEAATVVARSEQVRRQMAADVAHELRTPLAALQAGLEELRDGMSEPGPVTFARLHDQSLRLARTVDELAQLSAADAAAVDLHPVELDLSELISDEIAARLPQLRAAGLTLTQNLPDRLRIAADPQRLHQVIGNLLANCAQHCRPGDQVTVTAQARNATAAIIVSDTGPGIAPQDLPHVTTRFWRGSDRSTTPGSGIGLAVVDQLVHAHRGRLQVESAGGDGTTVTVELPRDEEPSAER